MRARGALVVVGLGLLALFLWFALASRGRLPRSADGGGATPRRPVRVEPGRDEPRLAPGREASAGPAEAPASGRVVSAAELFAARGRDVRRSLVRGRVVDDTRAPIEGVRVLLEHQRTLTEVARTGATGHFEAACTDLQTADRFLALAPGFAAAARRLERGPADSLWLGELVLEPGGSVSGTVVDAAGRPVDGAAVRAYPGDARPGDPLEFLEADDPVAWTPTGPDGRFRLDGIPIGEHFLRAGVWEGVGDSDIVEVRREEVLDVRIVLNPDPEADAYTALPIRGVVLASDGTPVEGLSVQCGDDFDPTDGTGRFSLECDEGHPVTLLVHDGAWRHGRRAFEGVVPGTEGLVLTLADPDPLEVALVDPAGNPVTGGQLFPDGNDGPQPQWLELGAAARVRIQRPARSFWLAATAPGYRIGRAGLFDPATVGDSIAIVLEPGGFVRGRVRHEGRPIAGATVALGRRFAWTEWSAVTPGDRPFSVRSARSPFWPIRRAVTDEEGAFVIPVLESGEFSLRLFHPTLGLLVLDPVRVEAEIGLDGLVVDWPAPGAIEGRVLVDPGRSAAGRIVGASDGNGFVHTTVASDEGLFRLDRLAAGGIQVRPCQPPVGEWHEFSIAGSGEPSGPMPAPWDCTVRTGETVHFDLDLRGECVLVGGLRLDGRPPAFWDAQLECAGRFVGLVEAERGRFRLGASAPGPCVLVLSRDDLRLEVPVELVPGETRRDVSLALGHVRVTGAPEGRSATLQAEGDLGAGVIARAGPWPGERSPLPVGRYRLSLRDVSTGSTTPAGTFEVRAGEETVVPWPR